MTDQESESKKICGLGSAGLIIIVGAHRKIWLYLPIEEEPLGPETRMHVRNEGFNSRVKTDILKRTTRPKRSVVFLHFYTN